TFRADVQVRREILVVDDLRTAGTLDPQALRHATGLDRGRGGDRRARLLEPGHGVSLSNTGYGLRATGATGYPSTWSGGRSTACRDRHCGSASRDRRPP